MKKFRKCISLILVVAMVITGGGFTTLANSLDEEKENSSKIVKELKSEFGEEKAEEILSASKKNQNDGDDDFQENNEGNKSGNLSEEIVEPHNEDDEDIEEDEEYEEEPEEDAIIENYLVNELDEEDNNLNDYKKENIEEILEAEENAEREEYLEDDESDDKEKNINDEKLDDENNSINQLSENIEEDNAQEDSKGSGLSEEIIEPNNENEDVKNDAKIDEELKDDIDNVENNNENELDEKDNSLNGKIQNEKVEDSVENEEINDKEKNVDDIEIEDKENNANEVNTKIDSECILDSENLSDESIEENIENVNHINEDKNSDEDYKNNELVKDKVNENEEKLDEKKNDDKNILYDEKDVAKENVENKVDKGIEQDNKATVSEVEILDDVEISNVEVASISIIKPKVLKAGSSVYYYLDDGNTTLHLTNVSIGNTLYDNGFSVLAYISNITKVVIDNDIYPDTCTKYFYLMSELVDIIGLNNLHTEDVNDISCMFYQCSSLTSIDLSSFDTSNVISMHEMFYRCSSLTSIDLSSFDTSNVSRMSSMFDMCSSLTSIGLSNFNTSNVTDMRNMFYDCHSLTSIDLSNFDTSNVMDMQYMFYDCHSLTSIDLSNFDTSNVSHMDFMFDGCSSLTSIDLSNFNTSNVTDMSYMFNNSDSLISIYVGNNFVVGGTTSTNRMFFNCDKIVGENGTTYDGAHIDGVYARMDGGPASATPGYFSSKASNKSAVLFETNGGSEVLSIRVSNGSKISIPSSTKTGYRADWYKDASFNESWDFDNDIVTEDMILYAKWIIVTYTITYEPNGGTITSPASFTKTYGQSVSLTTPTRDGYTFDRWFSDSGLTLEYDGSTDLSTTQGENITIYAKWIAITYTITYEPNGGTVSPTSFIKTYGQSVSLTTPIKAGLNFGGWYKESNFINQYVGNTDLTTTEGANITIYARWGLYDVYQVSFETNGGSLINSIPIASGFKIPEISPPTKSGFVFENWYKEPTFNTVWNFDSDVVTSDMTLYAKWEVYSATYTIRYNANGGNISATTITKTIGENVTLETPTKEGYIFDGWFEESGFINQYFGYTDLTIVGGSVVDIYAKWSPIRYNLIYNVNGGEITQTYKEKVYGQNVTLDTPTKEGYIFDGWFKESGLINQYTGNVDLTTIDGSAVNIYAKWTAITYTIIYEANGGIVSPTSFIKTYGQSALLTQPTKTGYYFGGWFSDSGLNNQYIGNTDLSNTDGANVTIYAKWGAYTTYQVSFETNGGSLISSIPVAEGFKIPEISPPTKSGFVFENWYKEPTFNTVWDFNNDIVTSDITLYARWGAYGTTYTIRYNTNGGNISATTITKTIGENIILDTPTKEGYLFDGWYKESDLINLYIGNTDLTTVGDSVVDIYAKWSPIKYNLIYIVNGGEITQAYKEKVYGQNVVLDKPVKSNNNFKGWFTDNSFTNIYDGTTDLTTISGAVVTIYAKWEKSSRGTGGGGGGGGGGGTGKAPKVSYEPLKTNAKLGILRLQDVVINLDNYEWIQNPTDSTWSLNIDKKGLVATALNKIYDENYKLLAKNCFCNIEGSIYYFDENEKMTTGWLKNELGEMYLFEWQKNADEGKMVKGWKLVNNNWYYFREDGRLLIYSFTPDGYFVDADGIYVENGENIRNIDINTINVANETIEKNGPNIK